MLPVRTPLLICLACAFSLASAAQPSDLSGSIESGYSPPHNRFLSDAPLKSPVASAAAGSTSKARVQKFWFGGGLGFGSYGLSGQLELAFQVRSNVLMARHFSTTDIFASITGTGLLYGWESSGVAVLGGIGIARGHRQHSFGEPGTGSKVIPTPGLALHGEVHLGHWGPLGLAISGMANVNLERSFGGVTLTSQIGHY